MTLLAEACPPSCDLSQEMMTMEKTEPDGGLILSFLEAAEKGEVEEMIRSLLIDRRLINAPHPETGNTALIVAAEKNNTKVIEILLEHGADVTFCNCANQTAVHVAEDGVRAQLLSAVTRTSYPQLSMLQAAWQGDLGRVQHLLSTDHGQCVHTRNGQGLTPVMLALRDVDLFVGLTMGSDYRPESVLQELLRHNVDTDLLDYGGRSAVSYLSEVKSPLRRQLTDALERCAPPDAHGGAFCDLCLDTKPSVGDAPPAGVYRSASLKENSKKLRSDGISSDILEENLDPAADPGAQPDLQEEITFQEIENFAQMQDRKGNPFYRQWFTDPATPEHLTPRSAIKRHPSLPPIHMKAGEEVSKLEKLGLGYLVQESYSEPNILECHLTPDPLHDIKSIKGHIWQRLGSAEFSRDSKTFPPMSRSPRSLLMPAKLKPLLRSSCRNKETNKPRTAQSHDNLVIARGEGLPYEHNLEKSLKNLDITLPRDLVQIKLNGSFCYKNQHRPRDDGSSETAEERSRTGSRRKEAAEEKETARKHISCRDLKPLLHTNDKTQTNCKETGTSLHIEQLQFQEHGEGFGKSRLREMEKEELAGLREDIEVEINDKSKVIEQNLGTATPTNEDTKSKVELKNLDSPRTPRISHVPFVHITFSEQEPVREIVYSPSKPFFTKRNMKPGSLLHNINHSFNILAQKENEKTTKSRKGRSMSAQDNPKHQRPLSNSNRTHGKSLPLPALVYSSVPSPSKMAQKVARSAQGSTDRRIQRSHTQFSLYSQKRMNSPCNTPILPTSTSSHDFQDIKYNDMFVEITSQQGTGPVMYQMFPPTVYVNVSNSHRKSSSASTTRSSSSKGSRAGSSRDSSARSKRPKLKNKKSPSATSQRRRNSSSKQEGTEKGENKTEDTVIISGVDWEIQTQKQGGDIPEFPVNTIIDAPYQNFELTTINEASRENSITIKGTVKETLKMLIELKRRSSNVGLNSENVDRDCLKEVNETGQRVQQDIGFTNSSANGDTYRVQVPKNESTLPPSQDLNATETPSQFQQDEALEDWVPNDDQKGNSVEPTNNEEDTYSSSQNIQGSPSHGGSEHLTVQLIACLEKLISTEEEFSESEDSDGEQGANVRESRNVDETPTPTNIQQVSANPSLTDHKSHISPTENQSGLHHNESSIHWIKGEVLGKGAYGTVYRGLTNQGELIAAKQVILHVSDPELAEKEYKKLQEEMDLLKTLKHPNIVGYLGTSFEDPVVTIFMEFVPGGSIFSNLRQFGPLKEAVISKYTSHILKGISYLHMNRVVHRDIKGNNVMLMPNGVIKLIDFGCAKRLNSLSINGTHGEMLHSMRGTPYWMAPEVINESGHGEKSDIWSIGCTVFEMATGKPPLAEMEKFAAMFYIGLEKGLMPTLPDHFSRTAREFVNLCLTRDQDNRPSAEQLIQHPFVRSISETTYVP